MNFKTSSIVILFLLVSFNSHSQLDFFVKMNEKFYLEIDKESRGNSYAATIPYWKLLFYPKFSTNQLTKNGLQKKLTKYQKKNPEDFTVKFFNYCLKIDDDFRWYPSREQRDRGNKRIIDEYISNVKLQYDIIKEINKLSPSELEIFSKYQDVKFLVEFLDKYNNDMLFRYFKKFPVTFRLTVYNTIKDNEMFKQEIKTNFLVEIFNGFVRQLLGGSDFNNYVWDVDKKLYECKQGNGRLLNYFDIYKMIKNLREISPKVDFESNWGKEYPFIPRDPNESNLVGYVSEFYSLLNFWSQSFKNIESIDKEKLGENKYFYELMKSDSWGDCSLIFDYISNPKLFNKKRKVLIGEFLQNTKCLDCDYDYFKKIKYKYDNVLKSLTTNTKGYCTREKHEERIEKEYYPDNGLKITRGITRIILTESGNCKYSWEVYDTSLLGKTRISYFITESDNPEDSTISIKLIGTDEF